MYTSTLISIGNSFILSALKLIRLESETGWKHCLHWQLSRNQTKGKRPEEDFSHQVTCQKILFYYKNFQKGVILFSFMYKMVIYITLNNEYSKWCNLGLGLKLAYFTLIENMSSRLICKQFILFQMTHKKEDNILLQFIYKAYIVCLLRLENVRWIHTSRYMERGG